MKSLSQSAFASLKAAHEAAGQLNLHEPIDLPELNFYNSSRQAVPLLIELAQGAAEALRQAEEDRKALAIAKQYASRLEQEFKDTAEAKRNNGEVDQAEAYDQCRLALSKLGIGRA